MSTKRPMAEPRTGPSNRFSGTALVLAGHGSSSKPDGGLPVFRHAEAIRSRNLFAEVHASFIRQPPELGSILDQITAQEIYVVPVLASPGYMAGSVITRELGIEHRVSRRKGLNGEQIIRYCDALGTHASIPQIIGQRIEQVCDQARLRAGEVEVLLVGHGTHRNPNSARQTGQVADRLAESGIAAKVHPVFLEQEPSVDRWQALTRAGNLIVVPFLIASGYHGAEDLPKRLGLDPQNDELRALVLEAGSAGPFGVANRQVWYCGPVGNEPEMAEAIIGLVDDFRDA